VFETYTEAPTGEGCFTKYTKSYKGYDECGGSTPTLHETWFAGDRTRPTITLLGEDENAFVETPYTCIPTEATAVANDNCDGSLAAPVPVKEPQCWTTKFTYKATDDCGNEGPRRTPWCGPRIARIDTSIG